MIRFQRLDGGTATYNPSLTLVQLEHQLMYPPGYGIDSPYFNTGKERWRNLRPIFGIERLDRRYPESLQVGDKLNQSPSEP